VVHCQAKGLSVGGCFGVFRSRCLLIIAGSVALSACMFTGACESDFSLDVWAARLEAAIKRDYG